MPFLTVITRHMPSRPNMLKVNQASLAMQSDPDYDQVLIVDHDKKGQGWASQQMALVKPKGKYVLILDDDDIMLNYDGIKILKAACTSDPPMLIFKGWVDGFGILPPPNVWEADPGMGQIAVFCYILRHDLWQEFTQQVASPEYHNDFILFHAAFKKYPSLVKWQDKLICATMRRSTGRPE